MNKRGIITYIIRVNWEATSLTIGVLIDEDPHQVQYFKGIGWVVGNCDGNFSGKPLYILDQLEWYTWFADGMNDCKEFVAFKTVT